MAWVALTAWILTTLGGSVLGLLWARHGGSRQSAGIRWPHLATQVALAVTGLVLWVVFAVGGDEILGWIALAVLAAVMVVGFSMVVLWLRGRAPKDKLTWLPAEAAFPLPLVVGHGLLALVTLLLGLLAALGVGT
jgi:hypothetical protein